jgi:lipopolysaccharide/colanic/teichoic acid biosynthesis glycosyltransferase
MLAEIDTCQEIPSRVRRDVAQAPHGTFPSSKSVPMYGPPWYESGKRYADVALALLLLAAAAPFLLLAMALVRLTSRGPALYSQTRLGRYGRPFTIYKLRTMTHNCESLTGAQWSTPGDSRVTPVGRFLRKTHIDELPQLWNVLKGDMSLVGPRPERPEFTPQLEQALPLYRERLRCRPGLTGLAQVQLPPDTDLGSVRLKLAYDLYYVQRVSLWMDARLLFSTAFHVLGVPFTTIRRLFLFPGRELVEGAFRALAPVPAQRPAPAPAAVVAAKPA